MRVRYARGGACEAVSLITADIAHVITIINAYGIEKLFWATVHTVRMLAHKTTVTEGRTVLTSARTSLVIDG